MIGFFVVLPFILLMFFYEAIATLIRFITSLRWQLIAIGCGWVFMGILFHCTFSQPWWWAVLVDLCRGNAGCPEEIPAAPEFEIFCYAAFVLTFLLMGLFEVIRLVHRKWQGHRKTSAT